MRVEVGQLRVWVDAVALDKTPFLVLEMIEGKPVDCMILWQGKIMYWWENRVREFSEVVDAS